MPHLSYDSPVRQYNFQWVFVADKYIKILALGLRLKEGACMHFCVCVHIGVF